MYLTGLKKWVIQKSFLSSSDIFADKTFKGIVDVLDEIIESSKSEANYIENQIRLQIEGKEAMNTVPSVFISEARHYNPTNQLTIN